MSQFAAILLLAFLLKLSCIGIIAFSLRSYLKNYLESILISWLFIQLLMYSWMILISFFHELNLFFMWVGLFLTLIISCGLYQIYKKNSLSIHSISADYEIFTSKIAITALAVAVFTFLFFFYRSLYFFDDTWDAFTYELTRILFYAHYQTLFIIQPTKAFNIFSNEWNGELNALFYVLVTGNDQGSSFGNVEIWLFSFFAFSCLAATLHIRKSLVFLIGLIFATAPICIGLAMTVKGDLLAIEAFIVGFVFMLRCYETKFNPIYLLAMAAAYLIAAGSKISVVPSAYLLTFITLIFVLATRKLKIYKASKLTVSVLLIFVISNFRYLANIFIYNTPFKHIESTLFSFHAYISNLYGIFISIFDIFSSPLNLHSFVPVLGLGLQWLSIFLLAIVFFSLVSVYKRSPTLNFIIFPKKFQGFPFWANFAALCFGLFLLMASTPWEPWSFRYFFPWIAILLIMLTAWILKYLHNFFISTIVTISLVCIMLNLVILFIPYGENFPSRFLTAMQKNQLDRKLGSHAILNDQIKEILIKNASPLQILINNQVNAAVSPFFGINHKNEITLVDSFNKQLIKLREKKYNLVIFSTHAAMPIPPAFEKKLIAMGYRSIYKNELFNIYQERINYGVLTIH